MITWNLNESQRQAVDSPILGPLLIVAGAGPGKTATLISRLGAILSSGVNPAEVVAITFTNKAADEMRFRVENSNCLKKNSSRPFIGTFHSFGVSILKKEASYFDRDARFSIFDNNDSSRLLRKIFKEISAGSKEINFSSTVGKISRLKNNLLPTESLSESSNFADRLAADVFFSYENVLKRNNAFDFDDLIEKPARIFLSNPDTLEKYRRLFRFILVDEYQDINPAQYQFIRSLAGEDGNLNVVGDDNQAIYGFRGADFKNFLNFDRDFKNARVVTLEENYRSTGNIIGAASGLILKNKLQRPKKLWTKNQAGSPVLIIENEDEEEEAARLSEKISILRRGGVKESITILYRTNAQSRPLEQAFIENNIPYFIFGGLRFYDRKEIKDIVSVLRFASNPKDEAAKERIKKSFHRADSNLLFIELLQKKDYPPAALIDFILKSTSFLKNLEKNFDNFREREENIKELYSFAASSPNLEELIEKISLFQSSDARPKFKNTDFSKSVSMMTIHLSKGLEFDRVFIAGLSEGLLPHAMSFKKGEDIEEERRLAYVAMTRARKNLYLSFHGLPSRFLGEIPSEFLEFDAGRVIDFDDEERYITI